MDLLVTFLMVSNGTFYGFNTKRVIKYQHHQSSLVVKPGTPEGIEGHFPSEMSLTYFFRDLSTKGHHINSSNTFLSKTNEQTLKPVFELL